MAKLQWDKSGERYFETGVDHGIVFPKTGENNTYATGVAWNGLTEVSESPEGGEAEAIYADNIKYLNLMSNEDFAGSITAYTFPDEFYPCDGCVKTSTGVVVTAQKRKAFGLIYRTKIGNDEDQDLAYKYHVVWNCMVTPSDRTHTTVNDTPEAEELSWDFTTTPEAFVTNAATYKPTAHMVIDTRYTTENGLAAFLAKIEGTDGQSGSSPTMPTPDEVISLLATT